MNTQKSQKNYLAGPDSLQSLTESFRSGLEEWRDDNGEPKLVNFCGKDNPLLCASVHQVLEYAREFTAMWLPIPEEQKIHFKREWFIDCRGLHISLSLGERCEFTRDWAPVEFDYSEIHDSYFLFPHKVFVGNASFYDVKFYGDIHFDEAKFYGEVNFDNTFFSREAYFVNCEFRFNKGASFQRATFSRRADFTRAVFYRAPIFHETKLPQGSSFTGARFENLGNDKYQRDFQKEIVALRTLRQLASSYKVQQDEAKFFALEQRYYRKVFLAPRLDWQNESYKTSKQGKLGFKDLLVPDTWHWSTIIGWKYCFVRWEPIEWLISLGYDWVSEYGSNPNRAVIWLIGINIMSFLLFLSMDILGFSEFIFVHSESGLLLVKQYPALFFTFQNVFNPSAIWSSKPLLATNNWLMLFVAGFQFISTYIVLIPTALAIRTRFQKGSGDK